MNQRQHACVSSEAKMKRNDKFSIITTVILLVILINISFDSCSENDDTDMSPTRTATLTSTPDLTVTPTHTASPTPILLYRMKVEFYLQTGNEGLYCVGHKIDKNQREIYSEPHFWMPVTFSQGLTFQSFIFWYIEYPRTFDVATVNDTLFCPAGFFENVIEFRTGGYSWATLKFKPEFGLLFYVLGGGHENLNFQLENFSLNQSGSSHNDYFALNVGNNWTFKITGNDAIGKPVCGSQTNTIGATDIINNQEVFIFETERELYRN